MNTTTIRLTWLLSMTTLAWATGCGDDAGGSGDAATGATTMAMASDTGPASTATPQDSSGTTSETSGGPACDPADAAAITMCQQDAAAAGTCAEVGDCNCEQCLCELLACRDNVDCTSIRECAQMSGCLGVDCYQPETCQAVIDATGGIGSPGAQLALRLSTCTEGAMCPVVCEGGSGSGGTTGGSSSG